MIVVVKETVIVVVKERAYKAVIVVVKERAYKQ